MLTYSRLRPIVALYLLAVVVWLQMKWLRTVNTARKVIGHSPTKQLQRIIASCPAVDQPHYLPPLWASNRWINLVLFIAKTAISQLPFCCFPLIHEPLTASDGGIISLDWSDDEITRALPPDAPILLLAHTITGKGVESTYFLKHAAQHGFRGVVLNRRGHAEPLGTASFNVIGDVEDCKHQVKLVRERYPDAWLGMAGVSMGSALVVNYLGQEGQSTPVSAGCVLCPAYDLESAFGHLAQTLPWLDRFVLKGLKKLWLNKSNGNFQHLDRKNAKAAENCANAETIDGFIQASVPFSNADTFDDYMRKFNPIKWCKGIVKPILVLNADDDMISLPCNIREDLTEDVPSAVLLRTTYGTHIAYSEGLLGKGNYMCRVSMEFLKAAYDDDRRK